MEQNIVNTAPEWVCDSPEKADWAIEKIKECRERRDLYIAAAESRIAQLKDQIEQSKEDCDRQTSYLMGALDSYLDMVPAKKSKTQISLDLPSGKIVRKLEHPDYVKNEPALLRYLQEHDPQHRTLNCLGCGYEHNCGIHGCAVINEAIRRLQEKEAKQDES